MTPQEGNPYSSFDPTLDSTGDGRYERETRCQNTPSSSLLLRVLEAKYPSSEIVHTSGAEALGSAVVEHGWLRNIFETRTKPRKILTDTHPTIPVGRSSVDRTLRLRSSGRSKHELGFESALHLSAEPRSSGHGSSFTPVSWRQLSVALLSGSGLCRKEMWKRSLVSTPVRVTLHRSSDTRSLEICLVGSHRSTLGHRSAWASSTQVYRGRNI